MGSLAAPSFGWMAWELCLATVQLPFGVVVGAVTERLSRRDHRLARLRNVIGKAVVAYISVSIILGGQVPLSWLALGRPIDVDGTSYAQQIGTVTLVLLAVRIVIFASGILVGTAMQPVGLTGGIATGKSTVSSLLQTPSQSNDGDKNEAEVEFVVIDVDGIAHDILLPHKLGQDSVYDRLVSEFGPGILAKGEGQKGATPHIDRRKLGDVVFRDRQKRRKLNSITHPTIIKIMLKRILLEGLNLKRFATPKSQKRRVVCVDIPLLFEGGMPMRLLFGTVIVVACNPQLQLERLQKRNPDLTLEQCQQRIASQIPVEEKARKAHVVVRNDGSLKSLKSRVNEVKADVANVVSGPQRGVELLWLVLGFGGLFFLRECN